MSPPPDDEEALTEPARDVPDLAKEAVDEPRTETTRFTSDLVTRAVASEPEGHRLIILEGGPLGASVEIRVPFTVGRDADNSLVLLSTGVSRTHALILREPDGHVLHDQGSSNGTHVNNERVTSHKLKDGDVIVMGGAAMKYLSSHNPEHRFFVQLHQTSVRDPLTGAPNRRYFDDFL